MSLEQAVGSATNADLKVAALRSIDWPEDGVFFVVASAKSVPLALVVLLAEFAPLIADPIKKVGRSIVVELTDKLAPGDFPLTFYWAVGTAANTPRLATFLVVNGKVKKLADKRSGLQKGKMWFGERKTGLPQ